MNIAWLRIRSWHAIVVPAYSRRTLCGRTGPAEPETSDTLPAGKSCETCLRIVARKADA